MLLFSLIIFLVLERSSLLIVNVKSVSFPFADIFCTTISTLIEFLDNGLKIAAAIPGLSLTPTRVTFASFWVEEIPVIILLLIIFFLFVMSVPDFLLNEDLTSISILFSLASCMDTGCITFAPNDAISNISS